MQIKEPTQEELSATAKTGIGAVKAGASRQMSASARLIAFYLPQFHPIPENDEWWGPGFTEWTNVAKAKPLFKGHHQPNLPADLGFYDLRVPAVRCAQAKMAREAGIEGFCYWHYWFAGRRLLERPFNEVLESGEPDFPFCLAWANQTWSGIWHGAPNRILLEQTYPGAEDNERHFYAVLPAFKDPRYIRVNNRPIFAIYRPTELPDPVGLIAQWRALAVKNGLEGVHFVAHLMPQDHKIDWGARGFSGIVPVSALKVSNMNLKKIVAKHRGRIANAKDGAARFSHLSTAVRRISRYIYHKIIQRISNRDRLVYDYEDAMMFFYEEVVAKDNCYPCVVPNWDNSARLGRRGLILRGSTPDLFRKHLREGLKLVANREPEDRVIFVKSWNEWAEGNYLEPDQKFGRQYLDVLREEVYAQPDAR